MRSPNDEGSQFSKLHFPCNKEERLVLNSFFREYNLYLKKKKKKTLNLFKVAYHPVSCLLHLHIDTLLSSALNDSEISNEEFTNIINEANIYENIKENIKELTIEPSSLERTTLEKSFKIIYTCL